LQTVLGQTNAVQACVDGYGNTNSQFDEALSPESFAARVASTTLNHDVVNLRYVVRHTMGWSQWWQVSSDVNFGHRAVRMHYGVIADQFNYMWQGRAHYWGGTVRQHVVSYSVSSYSIGTMHPESVMFLLHVGAADGVGSYGSFGTPSVRFKVGIGGDVHVGNTLMVHAAGTATHAAIFRAPSPATGISWPLANHLSISSINIAGGATGAEDPAEVARFHLGGIFLARSHVNGTTPPRNTLSASNLVKGWAVVNANGSLLQGYNVSTATRTGTGRYTITWQNPLTSASVANLCTPATTNNRTCRVTASGTAMSVLVDDTSGVAQDEQVNVISIGVQ
jgi:hypothetical protein